jgi:hypothetical protein
MTAKNTYQLPKHLKQQQPEIYSYYLKLELLLEKVREEV